MAESIKSIFDDECSGLEIDARLAKKLHQYQQAFVSKNEEHISFFGGVLLGVQVVRFTRQDSDRWFEEIMEVDSDAISERTAKLPTLKPNWNIATNTMNQSCVWLAHKFFTNKALPEEVRYEAAIDCLLVLQYKFFTSLLYQYFRFPADRAVAEATYAELTNKFGIKQHRSWSAWLRARAEDILSKGSTHLVVMNAMQPDDRVVRMLNDTQGRIRDMMKNIYKVFRRIYTQGGKIITTSAVVEHDGAEILKDKTKSLLVYERYLASIVGDQNSFIRQELLQVIESAMHTMNSRLFRETLVWVSNNYGQPAARYIEELVSETLIHSFGYLFDNRDVLKSRSNMAGMLDRLRGVYMSSRSTDPVLFSLREKAEKIVRNATGSKSPNAIAGVRTGLLLYLVLRAYTMRYYTSGAGE